MPSIEIGNDTSEIHLGHLFLVQFPGICFSLDPFVAHSEGHSVVAAPEDEFAAAVLCFAQHVAEPALGVLLLWPPVAFACPSTLLHLCRTWLRKRIHETRLNLNLPDQIGEMRWIT